MLTVYSGISKCFMTEPFSKKTFFNYFFAKKHPHGCLTGSRYVYSQPAFTCAKLTIEALEKNLKYAKI